MDLLETRLAELRELRDGYFEREPKGTEAGRVKQLAEAVDRALQEFGHQLEPEGSFAYELACGRIRNVSSDYNAKTEEHLTKAVKLDARSAEAWRELGQCLWKKPDLETCIDCFEQSLALSRTAQTLYGLAMALRRQQMQTKDEQQKIKLRERSLELSEEAVKTAPDDGAAWFSLANAKLTLFFGTGQSQPKFLVDAIESYQKALELGKEARNPDLHLNLATALRYDEAYKLALKHLAEAHRLDPEGEAAEKLDSLVRYLVGVNEAVARKGKQKTKRLLQMTKALSIEDAGVFATSPLKLFDGSETPLKDTLVKNLTDGENRGRIVVGVVVGVVPNDEAIPFTFALCDKEQSCTAVTVYNFSSAFGMLIGDTVAITEPFICDTLNVDVKGSDGKSVTLSFRSIRVQNPAQLVRNRKRLGTAHVALAVTRLDDR